MTTINQRLISGAYTKSDMARKIIQHCNNLNEPASPDHIEVKRYLVMKRVDLKTIFDSINIKNS